MGHIKSFEEKKTEEDVVETIKVDYYDQLLHKESSIWAPVRKWEKRMGFVTPIVWTNAFLIFLLHAGVLMYIYSFFSNGKRILIQTYIIGMMSYIMAGFGISAGAHRYWSHRSFKAKRPLKIFLLICYAVAGQVPVYDWARDHRVHHKKTETSSDPHDSNRGFFFSHVGWLMMKKHPHVIAEGAKVDMSDITGDPDIVFFDRTVLESPFNRMNRCLNRDLFFLKWGYNHFHWHFTILKIMCCFVIPTLLPVVLFGEKLSAAIIPTMIRHLILLNGTWSVNSFAHFYGPRPYNKNIKPSENVGVNLFTLGEGSHNFHHTFPWDYKSTETPLFSLTTIFLDMFVSTGLAYDMREASASLIKSTSDMHGDKTRNVGQKH